MLEKPKRTMLAFEVAPEIRQKIKILAARRNVSMNLWLMKAIADRIEKETKHDKE